MSLAKKLLQRRAAAERVNEIREKIAQLRAAMTRITPRYDANGGGGSGEDKMMAYAARLDQLEKDLTRASRRAYRISVDTLEAMQDLPQDEYTVIVCRDFMAYSWRATAATMGCSVRQAMRIREKALGYKRGYGRVHIREGVDMSHRK